MYHRTLYAVYHSECLARRGTLTGHDETGEKESLAETPLWLDLPSADPCGALFHTSYAANVAKGGVARYTIRCYTDQSSSCQTYPPTYESHSTAADMKVRLLQGLLSFSLLSSSLSETQHKLNTVEDALAEGADSSSNAGAAAGATNSEAISDTSTTFNGAKVPPMKVLTGRTFDDEVKHGYWYGL